jgi:hypothetical protein
MRLDNSQRRKLMPRWRLTVLLLAVTVSSQVSRGADQRTGKQKVEQTDWAGVRGVNFIPSYASNTYEIWRNYDSQVFDRELRLVKGVGYNSVRLWLNYSAFEELGSKMVDRVQDALSQCTKHNLKAVVALFDSCGVRQRKDARWMTAAEAYDLFANSSRLSAEEKQYLERLFGKYSKGFGKFTLVPVGSDSPIMTLLWQNWQPTPGNDRLGREWYPKMDAYVRAMLDRLKDHSSVLLWDLMNEPEFASEGPFTPKLLLKPEMLPIIEGFLKHVHGYVKQRYPEEIVGIGWASLGNTKKYADLADVLTFHVYRDPEGLQREIEQAVAAAKGAGKPILITETLANWDFGSPDFGALASDEQQLEHYRKVLPVLVKSPIGWMAWGMVMSQNFDPTTDIFYPNGHPRPAALLLEKMLKEQRP